MRWALLVPLLGCHEVPEPAPDPVALAKLDTTAQCTATATEYRRVQLIGPLGSGNLSQSLDSPATHLDNCHGEAKYAGAIVTCWSAVGCDVREHAGAARNRATALGLPPMGGCLSDTIAG